ncbi:YdbH domain-containing protein [Erythrobacter sp. HKB08]|uniref:intermembrane phospholipid transport protein YdbH family protein n=1 Tax=Erythrobacter sp. HKB08 TaxID=2502843 RepID=UPI001008CA26|nr:YdbH domain-containing protein [Erythrobacter sp. HKB08]
MVDNSEQEEAATPRSRRRGLPGRKRWILLLFLIVGLGAAWIAREQLAQSVIDDQLKRLDLPASYEIVEISPGRQVLANVIVGDPASPDFVAERVEIALKYGFGVPTIGNVRLVNPRLYGRMLGDGTLTFGSLDKLLFEGEQTGEGLPDLDLVLEDGRGLIETPYGPVGIKAEGSGNLAGGFDGILAANAPSILLPDCALEEATLYGRLSTKSDAIVLDGPLRLASADCDQLDASARSVGLQSRVEIATDGSRISLAGGLETGRISGAQVAMRSLSGPIQFAWSEDRFAADIDLTGRAIDLADVSVASAAVDATFRGDAGFDRIEMDGEVGGNGVDVHALLAPTLQSAAQSAPDSLLASLAGKLRNASASQLSNADFTGRITARLTENSTSVLVPQFDLRNRQGKTVLTASRVQYAQGLRGLPMLSGNFRLAGPSLPTMAGRMERTGGGATVLRLAMQPYASGRDSLAIPQLTVQQAANGNLTFAGVATASGALPGGSVDSLTLPLSGRWTDRGGLALWESCVSARFDRLALANLSLSGNGLQLCPARDSAILRYSGAGLRIAAGTPGLSLSGTLADTPIRLTTGAAGFAYPGVATVREIDLELGEGEGTSTFRISDLDARFGGEDGIGGAFSGARIALGPIPLDLEEAEGEWSFADGRLAIANGSFRLLDREEPARFYPLVSRDAELTLADEIIRANATLRAPGSDRVVTDVEITHNLGSGVGFADLDVPGLLFDERLQPDELTVLALGVVANVEGVVTGTGRIDWSPDDVTSSGEFSSEGLNLAAVFGPVEGASGTIRFDDLLSLTTAPNQSLRVASINPGIEVTDGTIGFSLRDGQFLGVDGGEWPFMGGTLKLKPVQLNLGAAETRRYVLEVTGLDAAIFVQTLELGNISATGTFDGQLPLEFDEMGNGKIDNGILVSRPPGGNLSYVGELTYEDLSPIANFAFDTLRSLDYQRMEIAIEGPLTGDILSQISVDGVSQGEGASRNFITRQIAGIPIRFNININAPFYKLLSSIKAMYDPAFVRDPRELGLLTDDGQRLRRETTLDEVEAAQEQEQQQEQQQQQPQEPSENLPTEEPAIQRRESENLP